MKKSPEKKKLNKVEIIRLLLIQGKKITRWAMIQRFGAVSLPDIIFKLRNRGYDIKTVMVPGKDRFSNASEHAVYSLNPEKIKPTYNGKKDKSTSVYYVDIKYPMTNNSDIVNAIRQFVIKKESGKGRKTTSFHVVRSYTSAIPVLALYKCVFGVSKTLIKYEFFINR